MKQYTLFVFVRPQYRVSDNINNYWNWAVFKQRGRDLGKYINIELRDAIEDL